MDELRPPMGKLREKIADIIHHNNGDLCDGADKILKLFPQWTNVEDGLPEEDGLYIVMWSNGSWTAGLKDYIIAHKDYQFQWYGPIPLPPKEG